MSSMDPMKGDSLIPSETMRRTSLQPFRLHQLQNTKSSSLMRQITQPTTFNSSYGRLLRSLVATADSSSPATIKTKLLNLFTPAAPSSSLESKERNDKKLQHLSSNVSKLSWMKKVLNMNNKVLVELINKHFPDWRWVLNEIQRYSSGGAIDAGILATFSDVKVNNLIQNLKQKNFPEVRKWVVDNLDNDSGVLMRRIYECSLLHPWQTLVFLLLCLSLLSISIRLPSLRIRKYTCLHV